METSRIFGLLCLCSGTAICYFLITIAHRIELYSSRSVSARILSVGVVIKVGVASKLLRARSTRAYAETPLSESCIRPCSYYNMFTSRGTYYKRAVGHLSV